MKMILNFVFIFVFIFSCSQSTDISNEKFGSIQGFVFDKATRLPISNAQITFNNTSYNSETDSLGYFFIAKIEVGNYMLIASRSEYESDTIQVDITKDDTSRIDLYLKFNSGYWLEPQDDAFILFFRQSNLIKIDSTLAGKIQYRLDIARTYDSNLDTLHAYPSWELGDLLIKIPDSIYSGISFDSKQFNYSSIDSICSLYHIQEMYESTSSGNDKWMKIQFHKKYNMPVLAEEFKKVNGILDAKANYLGSLPEGPPFNIYLEISDTVYKFWFYLSEWYSPDAPYHTWEIHVIDNSIVFSDKQ